MATSNCVWTPATKVPSSFVTDGNKLNFAVLSKVTDLAAGPLTEAEYTGAINAAVKDVMNLGEDAADAAAIVGQSSIYIGYDGGATYAVFDSPSGVFLYKETCGVKAVAPWLLGGAAVAGLIGYAVGSRKRTGMAGGLMGATVGVLAGAGAGYLLSKWATPAYAKTAGLGLIDVRRSR